MYVGSYDEAFRTAFANALEDIQKDPFEDTVKNLVNRIGEDVLDRVRDQISDTMISDVGDKICAKAAEVATRMLEEALAGDDDQLRNLFGFYSHQQRYDFYYHSQRWVLIEALMARRPDFFVDERLAQLEGKIEALQKQNASLQERLAKAHQETAEARGHW